jgi:hypothetical protein
MTAAAAIARVLFLPNEKWMQRIEAKKINRLVNVIYIY